MPRPRAILEGVLSTLVVLFLTWLASKIDAPIPLWVLFLSLALVFLVGLAAGRVARFGSDLQGYQADLLAEAISGLREVAAGRLDMTFEDFIELGVLAPARFGLSLAPGEEVRLSVLKSQEGAGDFSMLYESGHSLGRKANFSLPRVSMAGHALETKTLQWSNDVEDDKRWVPHPDSSNDRKYRSLACMPILVGDDAVAVLNVLSSEKDAFLTGDLTYIELLGGFLALAWALNDADSSNKLGPSKGSGT